MHLLHEGACQKYNITKIHVFSLDSLMFWIIGSQKCVYKILTLTASEESTVCNSGVEAVEGNEATESFSRLCWETLSAALM